MHYLVGGFNPFEKYARQNGFIFPKVRGEHKKSLKPPRSYLPKESSTFVSIN